MADTGTDTGTDDHTRRVEAEEQVAHLNAQMAELTDLVDEAKARAFAAERDLAQARADIARLESAFAAQDTANHSLLIGLHAAAGMAIKESIQGDRYAENLGDIIQKLTGGTAA